MQDLKFHELANIFPLLTGEPLQELASDIKANGLREPITLLWDQILDGRNRYNAAKLAGLNLASESFQHFNGDDPVAFVISKNIHRRHLTNDQRAQIAAELYEKLPKKKEGGDRKSLSQICDGDIPSADSQKQKVAKQMRVSVRGMERAAAIQNKDPEKAAEVKAGTKTIKEVEKELKPKKPATGRRGRVTPQLDKAREIIRENIEAEKPVSPHKLEQKHGISHVTFDMAITAELARKQALSEPTITPDMLSLTAQQKLELAIRQHKAKLDRDFHAAVTRRADEFIENTIGPILRKREAEATRVIESRKGVMTKETFRKIWACLHPDRILDPEQKPKYQEAFTLFEKVKMLLLNEQESPTRSGPCVPTTPAEWEALKRQANERKAKRGQKGGTNIEKSGHA
jgi:ParB-like chromosome segregation protein Spo0J